MRKLALLACDDLTGYTVDDDLLVEPFAARGWQTEFISWNAPDVDWRQYEAAIIRATWDYQHHLPAYLAALQHIESVIPLHNPYRVVAWNSHKKYLLELQSVGVPIVPTRTFNDVAAIPFASLFDEFNADELVVKPMVSAGAYKTTRFTRAQLPELHAHFLEDLRGHDLMVQPFVKALVEVGEYALFYFNGALSHTCIKVPTPGDFRVQEEWGGEITQCESTPEMRALGEAVLAAVPAPCLYARVDIVQSAHGEWQLMEVELIEPSLYFRTAPGSPERFVEAFLRSHGAT